jgi:RNA polymerase sigma factor (sigma-70 family)
VKFTRTGETSIGRRRQTPSRARTLEPGGDELAAVPSIGRASTVESTAEAADSAALAGLYERHSQAVFRLCLGYLRKRDEAEDAAQTTFLHALRALHRGVIPTSESAWLLKIARNVCLNRFDSARRRGNLELVQDPLVLAEISPARPNGEMDLLGLQAALKRLPPRQRQAILLREWQGLSYAEIGEELGLTTSAVETLLFRARRTLARELGGEEGTQRRGLDLAGLFGWAKALLGGTAAKVAVGAAVVATVGAVAPIAAHDLGGGTRQPASRPATHAKAPAVQAAVVAVGLAHVPTRLPSRTAPAPVVTHSAPTTPAAPTATTPTSAPPATPTGRSEPASPAAPASSSSDPAPTPTTALPTTTPISLPSVPDPTQSVTVPIDTPTVPDAPQLPPLPVPPPPDLPKVDPPKLP